MRTSTKVAGGLVALLVLGSWLGAEDAPSAVDTARSAVPSVAPSVVEKPDPSPALASPRPEPTADLLQAASGGDGDSWRDTSGREYRLGMVNAPEVGECWGDQATAARRSLVADGFRAEVYTRDRYGRGVSVVTAADGTNVNVALARRGHVDDRYLDEFRHENRSLAAALDAAFAAAKRERAGLWGSCSSAQPQGLLAPAAAPSPAAPPPAAAPAAGSDCHPDYATCIPIQGDGSGRGDANDLDCGQIGRPVQLRTVGVDPYRLDANDDGIGCNG